MTGLVEFLRARHAALAAFFKALLTWALRAPIRALDSIDSYSYVKWPEWQREVGRWRT